MDKQLPISNQGYVTVEYAVVTATIIIALLMPIPGIDESLVDLVMGAIREFQAHTTIMLALP